MSRPAAAWIEKEKLKKKIKRLLEDAKEDNVLVKKIRKVLDESMKSGYEEEEDFDDEEEENSDEVETDVDELEYEDFDEGFEERRRKKSLKAAKNCGSLKGTMDAVPETLVALASSPFDAVKQKFDEIQWTEDDFEWNYEDDEPQEVIHLDFNEARGKTRIKLQSNDGVIYEMDEDVACKSNLIKDIRRDTCECDLDYPIRVSLGNLLKKALEYCHKYRHVVYTPFGRHEKIELTDWDRDYLNIPYEELPALLRAADYLVIPGLVEIIIQRMTEIAKGRRAKEILEIFKTKNNLSADDEEKVEVAVEDPFRSDKHRYYILSYLSWRE